MVRLLSLLLVMTVSGWSTSLSAAILGESPDVIVCSVKDPTGFLPWEELVFYVSAFTRDGETLYKTLTSDPVVIIVGADGVLQASNLADCDGRPVADLLEDGRAFFLDVKTE